MLVSEFKKIIEPTTVLGKGFVPITEYVYIEDKTIKVTNLESFVELETENPMPFAGCVLAEKLNKFLTSMDKDAELTFATTENVLTIHYSKKNKFAIPMQPLRDFPDTPSIKYNDVDLLCSFGLTEDFIKTLETTSKFISTTKSDFNGVYLKSNKMYGSNRDIIYIGDVDVNYENSIFIPYSLIKLLIKFKKTFQILEVYPFGFKATGFGATLYHSGYEEVIMPKFDNVVSNYKPFLNIKPTEELKSSISRIGNFDGVVNIHIEDRMINIHTDNINETIEISDFIDENKYSFKFNTVYLNKLLICETISFVKTEGTNDIKGLIGTSENCKIICAVMY